MTRIFWHEVVRLGLASVVVGSAIASFSFANAFGSAALAQVVPDSQVVPDRTLGADNNSIVGSSPDGIDTISGGATQGNNLFHSFDRFSIPNGRAALFDNAANIQNILTRVTGGSRSDIDGILAARGTANLFLLNPNGIIFGQNARLLIGGSFISTTANSINFADGTQFSATPGTGAPLLTVSVPLGLQFGASPREIVNRASDEGLQVDSGKTLGLIGGNVNLEGGRLTAAGGRIELGAVAAPGLVGINPDTSGFRFSFPTDLSLSDVSLTNAATAITLSNDGGGIAVNARNLNIAGSSSLLSGIILGTAESRSGNIEINARDTITVDGTSSSTSSSGIQNSTLGLGNAGNISIATGSLNIIGNAQVGSLTNGQGNAGNVDIQARDRVTITGSGGLLSAVAPAGVGNGADIRIRAGSLFLANGGLIGTSTLGRGNAGNIQIETTGSISTSEGSVLQAASYSQGNAGNITITAGDRISFDGGGVFSILALPSAVPSNPTLGEIPTPQGDRLGGDIRINGRSLSLENGAAINTGTLGKGNAGSIFLRIDEAVSLAGSSSFSGIFSSVGSGGEGNGGTIDIKAGSLSLTNGGQIVSQVDPAASGLPAGRGNGGKVIVDVRDRFSASGSSNDGLRSGVFTAVGAGAVGQGGDIEMKARSLSLENGAAINASTLGKGNAGSIFLRVDEAISLAGSNGVSAIFSSVGSGGEGNGGTIDIKAGSLSLTNGGQIVSQVDPAANELPVGRGNGGKIVIDVRDRFSASGSSNDGLRSGIFATVGAGAAGDGGTIDIQARSLSLSDNSQLNASSNGQGNAGSIDVNVRTLDFDRGGIFAESTSGNGGNIQLRASKSVRLRNGSRISTSAGTEQQQGNGGNITIDSPLVIANANGNNDITANAFRGRGGRIEINAQSIFGLKPRTRQELQLLLGTATPTAEDFLNALNSSSSNDVAAISVSDPALSGTVSFNAADVDPSRDLVELPTGLVDASTLVASGCPSGAENRFTVAGRGGLPPAPGDKLSPDALLTDWASLSTSETGKGATVEKAIPEAINTTNPPVETITEATSWQFDRDGNTILTAAPPTSDRRYDVPATSCHGS